MRISIATAVACLTLSTFNLALSTEANAAIKRHTNIPAQELGSALESLAKEHGFQLLYRSELVGDRNSPGAVGELTIDEALTQLLKGTGITYQYLENEAITLVPSSKDLGKTGLRTKDSGLAPQSSLLASSSSVWDRFRYAQADGGGAGRGGAETVAADSKSELEEVIVTAQKRQERLMDVPVPVTAIHAETLLDSGQLELQDYYNTIPGLALSMGSQSRQDLAIRGITSGSFQNPTVGVIVDDVPFGSVTSLAGGAAIADIDPANIAQIEVLRGPQGTLYGASSMGGLLKFVTTDPSMTAYSARVEAGFTSVRNANDPGYNLRASINLPIADTFAIRASGFKRQDAGYLDNPTLNSEGVNEVNVQGGNFSALWQPTDVFSLKLSALYQESKGDSTDDVHLDLGDLKQAFIADCCSYERTVQAYSANVKLQLGSASITSITGYNINRIRDASDASAVVFLWRPPYIPYDSTGVLLANRVEANKFSQEVRLAMPVGGVADVVIGAFYTDEDSHFHQDAYGTDAQTGARLVNGLIGDDPITYKEYAAFGNVTFHLADRFDLQVGGRESKIKQTFQQFESGPLSVIFFGSDPYQSEKLDTSSNVFTYLLTPQYRFSDNVMGYARFASGYRVGGGNVAFQSGAPLSYEPDKTKTYEVGLKGDFLDKRLSVDTSLYYIDWKDIQLHFPQFMGYFDNAGAAKSEGVELSVTSRPLTGLTVSGWVAYNNAVLTEDAPSEVGFGLSGDRLPYSSRWSGNLNLEQRFPLGSNVTGIVGAGASYVGDRTIRFREQQNPTAEQPTRPSYVKADLRVGVKYDAWTVNAFVNNIADERGVLGEGSFGTVYLMQPRTIGLSIVRTF